MPETRKVILSAAALSLLFTLRCLGGARPDGGRLHLSYRSPCPGRGARR